MQAAKIRNILSTLHKNKGMYYTYMEFCQNNKTVLTWKLQFWNTVAIIY
jgi:Fic family protein